ncbi:hypothetical protein MNEG_16511, partial [Monoraphidium neglectum]
APHPQELLLCDRRRLQLRPLLVHLRPVGDVRAAAAHAAVVRPVRPAGARLRGHGG